MQSPVLDRVDEELVFRALGDPHRRMLLDLLFQRDGQTLGELDAHLPMTRFGTMKHLRTLESAGLVATRRDGRRKLHFLNAAPLRAIQECWLVKYTRHEGRTPTLHEGPHGAGAHHGHGTNGNTDAAGTRISHAYETFIRATPDKIWEAITSSEFTAQYYYGTFVASEWRPGAAVIYTYADGKVAADGTVLVVDPPHRLIHTFSALWDPEVAPDRAHRVTWTIQPMGRVCRLTMEHDDFDGPTATYRSMRRGSSVVLNGLKTLLETGEPLSLGS